MKIKELIENVNRGDFNLEILLDVKKYIPVMQKKQFAMDIIAACTDENDGFISVDRFKMNIYFNMKVLGLYTNLEIVEDFDEMIEQYDMLCEKYLLDIVFTLFKDDYAIMCTVLEGILDELLIQNSIDSQVVKIANRIMNILDILEYKMDDINSLIPEGMDLNKLTDMLK